MNYTKGEWKIEHEFTVMAGNRCVASCGGYSTNFDVEKTRNENIANAQLISAAPDMYEILQDIRDGVVNNQERIGHDRFDKLIKALSKADGK